MLRRPARRPAPKMDTGEFPLQEPPGLPEEQGGQLSSLLMYLPMVMMSGGMMLMFIQPGFGSRPVMYLAGGAMAVGMVIMLIAQLVRAAGERKLRLKGERRDYLRYLGQARRVVRKSVERQREAVLWTHPAPDRLWSMVRSERLWERRVSHQDFCEVRIGLGEQRLAMRLQAPQTKPVEDLEPLCAGALRRFLKAYSTVDDMPIALYLRGFARVSVHGERAGTLNLVRALLAQLITFHAPDDLRVAVCAASDRLTDWDWLKWAPQALHPTEYDATGPVRLIHDTWSELEELLGGKEFGERGRFDASATPTRTEPYVVVVVDGATLPANSRLAGPGYRNLVAVDISHPELGGSLPWRGEKTTLRLRLDDEGLATMTVNRRGDEYATLLGRPDALGPIRARALARQLAPYRIGAVAESADPTGGNIDLLNLLGVGDARTFVPAEVWRNRSTWDHLRVPIGVNDRGQPVELDLKESAQGGMGPHGILIGATGSGKSETIRTLVLALALAHSSERLNMVLVDFKGGATFLGLDGLPHVSAFITNLAYELPLVDRMQDALQGELVRRQELLRRAGFSSIHDYTRARDGGADLAALPTMVVIVDEFGELLATKGEFMDLFIMIGRLGRSLGVHLLLASQRLEEGRIHTLETHLSYRMGLRMFSAMESRSVIGTTDAYDKPLQPGTGYLRTDTTTLVRFKGAYVSGPYRAAGRRTATGGSPAIDHQVVPFTSGYLAPVARPTASEPAVDEADEGAVESILEVVVDRLRDAGPPAHRVWLPPLTTPATLDELLPPLAVHPERGFGTGTPSLALPVGLIDRPFDQRRDPMVVDLSAGKGHVAVVGALQSGKSNVLRTIIAGLALRNTPREVQFYLLDFGGGGMSTLAGLPQVGAVAGRLDRERVIRTVNDMANLLVAREHLFSAQGIESMAAYRRFRAEGRYAEDPYGDVFLVVDGWFTMRSEFEALEPVIQEIATRGLTYGIHLMLSSNRWSEIRMWLRDLVQTKLELRLGDGMDSEMDFRTARTVPEQPGRGINADKYHWLAAVPRIDGQGNDDDVSAGLGALVATVRDAWSGPAAPRVRMLPTALNVAELPAPEPVGPKIVIGLDEQRLAPVVHDFDVHPHLMVFGDTETGKSNLLRVVAQAITSMYTPDQARIMCADPRRQLHDVVPASHQLAYVLTGPMLQAVIGEAVPPMQKRVPGPDIAPERLPRRDWWTGPKLFVIIDDYDLISSPMDSPTRTLVELVTHGADIGLHVVIARSTANGLRAMTDPLLRRLWDGGTPGLLMSCRREEGTFLGDAKPLILPPGRAQLVDRRKGVRLIQTAIAAPVTSPNGD
ncbi:type VII secretion protein EccC [Micromonospora sonneratiae]|uniref:Type VII secretion protein EccCa n=1 Tax=Micromonospora sonneratiae TaxID=1184706 RepID=A0ABW3YB98_9ACTN